MSEQPMPEQLDPAEELPDFIEVSDVQGQPDEAADQTPYADEPESEDQE
jgi:hypothetical protein